MRNRLYISRGRSPTPGEAALNQQLFQVASGIPVTVLDVALPAETGIPVSVFHMYMYQAPV